MKQKPGLIKQLSSMQKKMEAAQAEIAGMTFEGVVANGLVKVKVTGEGSVKSINFDESLVGEDLETLGDLAVAAINHAQSQKEAASKQKLMGLAGNLLPLGMKIPGIG
jgi:DNA-binding YbaB/EbfC family protein